MKKTEPTKTHKQMVDEWKFKVIGK